MVRYDCVANLYKQVNLRFASMNTSYAEMILLIQNTFSELKRMKILEKLLYQLLKHKQRLKMVEG